MKSPAFAKSLAAECDGLLRDYEKTKRWLWKASALTNYAAISSLQPQAAQVTELSGVLVCEIQITGGFSHSGIFYVPKAPPDGKQLVRGNWEIKPIGTVVFGSEFGWKVTSELWKSLESITSAKDLEIRLMRGKAPTTGWFAVDFYKVDKWIANARTTEAK